MGIVYSLYDALVSINVPDEKAKAVIDALEREMMDNIASKADVAHLQGVLSRDIRTVQEALSSEIRAFEAINKAELIGMRESMATKIELANLGKDLTTRILLVVGGATALTISILGMLIKFS